MIDVKTAVNTAITYLKEVYDTREFREILLEEVERSADDQYWLITLGYSRPTSAESIELLKQLGIPLRTQAKYIREYKVFTIDSNNGEVRSMKIRQL